MVPYDRRGVAGGSIAGKNAGFRGDYPIMEHSCGEIRKSISVALDGETPPLGPDVVELHLTGCDACRHWREAAHEVTRQYRLQGAQIHTPTPDVVRTAVVAAMPHRRSWVIVVIRVALAIVGLTQVVITGRLLLSGDSDRLRDLGAVGVALGVGFLVAAVHPYRATAIRPIVATAALLLVGSALFDLAHHRTTASDEAPHLLAVVGCLLVMVLAWWVPDPEVPPSRLVRRICQWGRVVFPGSRHSTPQWGHAATPIGAAMASDARSCCGGRSGSRVVDVPGIAALAVPTMDNVGRRDRH